ncbi:hypothetical protein [Ktedonospora formicarum]|uniref:Uncharacterized protein n=1 Tax=Ktedonospora formicarum TaxID=2778364 RepID=A0A8J3MYE0_9CHLR|nr:hypothetical protein [Ktedonospora formicarum]GHO50876.1 hypothetical protein KSX_90390 [Ktedonospora formicarum]
MSKWSEMITRFEHVTDKLGKGIDDGILTTVVALNVLGIHTTGSCEGHIEWGLPYPWIDIQPELEGKHQLYEYLKHFYQSNTIDFDRSLTFHGYRLRSQGSAFSSLFTESEKQRKLEAYQAEMNAFAAYLKTLIDA